MIPTPPFLGVIPMPVTAEGSPDYTELPEPEGFYYVSTRNGHMIVKQTAFGRVIVPVAEIPSLPNPVSFLWQNIPPIPAGLIGQVWSFFSAIWDSRKSEAMIYLTRNSENVYRVFVPPQKTSTGHVDAKLDLTHISRGWQLVGTIHSHCNFGAFHSGTDTGDADGHDGLHITIGHVDRKNAPEYAVMLSFNKVRWDLKIEEVTREAPNMVAHPKWWERMVAEPEARTVGGYVNGHWQGQYTGQQHTPSIVHAAAPSTSPKPVTPAAAIQTSAWSPVYTTASDAMDSMVRRGRLSHFAKDELDQNIEAADELDNLAEWLANDAAELGIELSIEWMIPSASAVPKTGPSTIAAMDDEREDWKDHTTKPRQIGAWSHEAAMLAQEGLLD